MKKIIIFLICLTSRQFLDAKNFILISAPGSGKGTFSQYLVQHHGHVQISLGDIFREEIRIQSELGLQIESYVETGQMVPDEIKCPIIFKHLSKLIQEKKEFILDGFPSSQKSFELTYKFLEDLNLLSSVCFVQFLANDQTCCDRITQRMICTKCCRVYNTISMPPQNEDTCDDCKTKLTQRKDAGIEIIMRRLGSFHTDIEPLLDLATEKRCDVHRIRAECTPCELITTYETLATGASR